MKKLSMLVLAAALAAEIAVGYSAQALAASQENTQAVQTSAESGEAEAVSATSMGSGCCDSAK